MRAPARRGGRAAGAPTSTSNSGCSSSSTPKRATCASVRPSARSTGWNAGRRGSARGAPASSGSGRRGSAAANARLAARLARAAAVEQQVVAREVLDQQAAVAVVDQAARRLDRQLAQPVVLGELAVVVAAARPARTRTRRRSPRGSTPTTPDRTRTRATSASRCSPIRIARAFLPADPSRLQPGSHGVSPAAAACWRWLALPEAEAAARCGGGVVQAMPSDRGGRAWTSSQTGSGSSRGRGRRAPAAARIACCAAAPAAKSAARPVVRWTTSRCAARADAVADGGVGEAVEPERPAREAVGEEARGEAGEHAGDRLAVARLERHDQEEEIDGAREVGPDPRADEVQRARRRRARRRT